MHEGWWQATDGKWYPPELYPDATNTAASPQTPTHDDWALPGSQVDDGQASPSAAGWVQPGFSEPMHYPQPHHHPYQQPFQQPYAPQYPQHHGQPVHHAQPQWVTPTAPQRPAQEGSWWKAINGGLSVFFWVAPIYWAYGTLFGEYRRFGFHPQATVLDKFYVVAVAVVGMTFAAMLLTHMATDRKRQMGGTALFASSLVGLLWWFFVAGMGNHSPFVPHGYVPWAIGVGIVAFLLVYLRLSSRRVFQRRTRLPEAVSYIVPPVAMLFGLFCLVATGASDVWFASIGVRSEGHRDTTVYYEHGDEVGLTSLEDVLDYYDIDPIDLDSSTAEQVVYYDSLRTILNTVPGDYCHGFAIMAYESPVPPYPEYDGIEAQLLFYIASYNWTRDHTRDEELIERATEAIEVLEILLQPHFLVNAAGIEDETLSGHEQAALNAQVDHAQRSYNEIADWFAEPERQGYDIDRRYEHQCQ